MAVKVVLKEYIDELNESGKNVRMFELAAMSGIHWTTLSRLANNKTKLLNLSLLDSLLLTLNTVSPTNLSDIVAWNREGSYDVNC